jgi:hypothetical protein
VLMRRSLWSGAWLAVAVIVATGLVGCQVEEPRSPKAGVDGSEQDLTTDTPTPSPTGPACPEDPDTSRARDRAGGGSLGGDVDGDGRSDRVRLVTDMAKPLACRHTLMVETATDVLALSVRPSRFVPEQPKLLLLAQIDGRGGLETVIALSPSAVFRTGAVFTVAKDELIRMRLRGKAVAGSSALFPFYDEFTAGVDCSGSPRDRRDNGPLRPGRGRFHPGHQTDHLPRSRPRLPPSGPSQIGSGLLRRGDGTALAGDRRRPVPKLLGVGANAWRGLGQGLFYVVGHIEVDRREAVFRVSRQD